MLWGILWAYKQQVDYIHLHTVRFFFPLYLWEKCGSYSSLELVCNPSTIHGQLWEKCALFFIVINCFRARLLMYKDEERSQLFLRDNLPFSNVSHTLSFDWNIPLLWWPVMPKKLSCVTLYFQLNVLAHAKKQNKVLPYILERYFVLLHTWNWCQKKLHKRHGKCK